MQNKCFIIKKKSIDSVKHRSKCAVSQCIRLWQILYSVGRTHGQWGQKPAGLLRIPACSKWMSSDRVPWWPLFKLIRTYRLTSFEITPSSSVYSSFECCWPVCRAIYENKLHACSEKTTRNPTASRIPGSFFSYTCLFQKDLQLKKKSDLIMYYYLILEM